MDNQEYCFHLTRDALKAKQNKGMKQGKGNKQSKADAITYEEIKILYKKKILRNLNS